MSNPRRPRRALASAPLGERFRLRRTAEICQGILDDADAGRMSLNHTEAGPLGVVARELGRRITEAHTR